MKTILMNVAISFALLVVSCKKSEDQVPNPNPTSLEEAIENKIQPLVDDEILVGVAIGIIDEGEEKQFFFGEKEKGKGNLPDQNTLFEIGSITKTFTGTLLADMHLKSELDLLDAAGSFLPEIAKFPTFENKVITLADLATHHSSLPRMAPDWDQGSDFNGRNPFANYTQERLYKILDGLVLTRPIGSAYEYSNLGMGTLAHILAEVNNSSYKTLVEDRIFSTLGMTNTKLSITSNDENFALPHDRGRPIPFWDFQDCLVGMGGIKSSIKDMMKYLRANMGIVESPLKAAIELAQTERMLVSENGSIGLAWNIFDNSTQTDHLIGHNGGTAGSRAMIAFFEKRERGIVLLLNDNLEKRSSVTIDGLAIEILNLLENY